MIPFFGSTWMFSPIWFHRFWPISSLSWSSKCLSLLSLSFSFSLSFSQYIYIYYIIYILYYIYTILYIIYIYICNMYNKTCIYYTYITMHAYPYGSRRTFSGSMAGSIVYTCIYEWHICIIISIIIYMVTPNKIGTWTHTHIYIYIQYKQIYIYI